MLRQLLVLVHYRAGKYQTFSCNEIVKSETRICECSLYVVNGDNGLNGESRVNGESGVNGDSGDWGVG
jgi:hypothetical protein